MIPVAREAFPSFFTSLTGSLYFWQLHDSVQGRFHDANEWSFTCRWEECRVAWPSVIRSLVAECGITSEPTENLVNL